MKLLIVGGVAGGASAAARARRLSEKAQITLFERGPDVSFANCGLPYYIGGEISSRDKLLVARPIFLMRRFRIDVRTRSQIEKIDRAAQRVVVRDLNHNETYEESYDRLILATGAAPIRLDIPGSDLPGVFTLRNLEDTDRIKAAVDKGARHAVVVGAGFIGLELIENFVRRGLATTLVELQDQVLPPLDKEMTQPILNHLREHKVDVHLADSSTAIAARAGGGLTVTLKSGAAIDTDLVILGVGVRPENKLATDAGLDVGPRGGVRVNPYLQTSDPNIYAVGDVIETTSYITGNPLQIPLAGPANRQGRIAADHIFGRDSRFRGAQGTAILRVFELTAALTGETQKTLTRAGRPFLATYVHPAQHASYYPGATPMTIKLLADPATGRILGAQAVGREGVDSRMNVLAMAIHARMTVFDLEQVELVYSPQYGSAKDAINMAGFVAANVMRGDVHQIHASDLPALTAAIPAPYLLDVREPGEFATGAIPGAVNLPLDDLRLGIEDLPRDRPIIAYCQAGQRGYVATRILMQLGFNVRNLAGGYKTYKLYTG